MSFEWSKLDSRAVTTAKLLAGDAVEAAGSGHPGAAISLAPAAYLLFQRHLRFDPADPQWLGRDRFVLSIGHSSLTQYIQLYMAGAGLELDDLKSFRKLGSRTPGHPEYRHTAGVEVTTGPLGSGVAAAVGMAMDARYVTGLLDPQEGPDADPILDSLFGYRVYSIVGDGCLQEGITQEAISLAGTQKLGNLVVIYDNNAISIEDDISVAFNEDIEARFAACGWHTLSVDWTNGGGEYHEDVAALDAALTAAKAETNRPTLINLRTIIGWPSPNKQNTGGIHGAPLGQSELAGLKLALGADPEACFDIDTEAVDHARANAASRGHAARSEWDARYAQWREANGEGAALLDRLLAGELPAGIDQALPRFEAGTSIATRVASGQVINALGAVMPELWGGSADLAGSNMTLLKGEASFLPPCRSSKAFSGEYYGRNIHFGVREHAMGAVLNGIALGGLTRPYGGTFFVFSDYMRGAVRLGALMKLPVTYVWTHDSIGVGEDGPTHQPVEHLASYRAIPNLDVIRPADANETALAWAEVLRRKRPAALALSRQNLPVMELGQSERTDLSTAAIDPAGVGRGAYIVRETGRDAILIATGSEVSLALGAQTELAAAGIGVRVVSMPCQEWFDEQDQDYRDAILDPAIPARLAIEAGIALPWHRYLGPSGQALSIETFGLPASPAQAFEYFGFTVANVVSRVQALLD